MTSVVKLALQNLSNEEVKELKVLAEARGIRSNSKDNHAISRAERVDVLPLSFAQQRVWFMSQEDKNSASYHIPIAFRIYGDIDSLAMQRSFQGLLDRHESLRTVFSVSLDGQPHARLLSTDANFRLLEIDLMGHLDGTKALKELVREQSLRPFDLTQGPLIRACMVHLRDQEHVLIVIQHHIVSDGWSIGILLRELSALYNAFVRGSPSSLSPLEIQYPDYASWQRTWFNDNRLASHLDYWRQALFDAPVVLTLPTDRPRTTEPSRVGAFVPIHLDKELTGALKHLGQKHGVTLFIILFAAWAAVLSRLAGQDDLVIGIPSANRGQREVEPLIGFFVNTLALRVDLSDSPTIAQLLNRVRDLALSAQEHQDAPFEQVVEHVNPPRCLEHSPLFQVLFAWQNVDEGILDLSGLRVEPEPLVFERVKFDLELILSEVGDSIRGGISYATDLFDSNTVERHAGYLNIMLKEMVDDAHRSIATVDLLPPDERTLLLETWNRTQSPYPMDRCIHQLFEDQVRAAPGATALIFGDDTVSFEQLNAQANQLAHFLVQQGVKPDDRVAICVERSIELVIGVLAVLKAGCAYVPLDPAYPSGRLGTILMDADPAFLLCDVTGRRLFDEEKLHGRRLVELDSASPVWNDCTDSNLDPRDLGLLPEHMAYVIYTSGSTGTPKGVMVEHRQLVNYFTWALPNYYADAGGSGSPTTMSFSFDGSVTVILGALIAGQPLTILPTEQQFESILNGRPYALVKLTPSHLKVLNSLLASGNPLPPACKLLLGGEAIAPDDLEIWQRMYPGVALINEYGPTETTIGCTTYTVTGPTNGMTHVPIGRPIANTRVYLLDDHHQPVPIGARGEIYIGGDGVTRGYLNRPDLTAERFLTDPFSSSTGARMYRTGDLARYLPDGNLIYLGRNDNQIKIRGFRIEPGEIEKCLTEHPSVSEAIVIASNTDTDIRLTAYVAPHANVTEDLSRPTALESELRIHAAKRLPSYMVPTMFVFLDAFPRSPNGKLDHGALPYPGSAQSQELQGGAPQGPIEAFIATVWMDLFDRSDIDRADNFFDLGGHSLLVINLISLCKRKGLLLTASDVFQHPVLHTLAARLESNIGKNDDDLVIIRAGKCGVPVYFVPSGKGDYSYAFNLTSNIKADCPIYAIPWPSVKEMKNLATMSGMAQRAIGVIKQIQPQGPYRLIGYSSGGILAHAIAKALTMAGDIVSFVGLIDVPTPSEKLFPAITAKRLFLEEIYRSANKSTADRITLIQRNADDISLEDLITRCTNDGLITDQFDRFSDSATWERRSTYTSAIRNYNPAGLEARVHHFHATECSNNGSVDIDTTLSEEDERCPSPAFLWKEIPTPNKMEFVGIPGDHFSMIEDPTNNMRLAKHLDNCLSNGIWTADDFGTQ